MKYFTVVALSALFSLNAVYAANSSNVNVGVDQGGNRMYVGNGGTLDIETGGIFSLNSTTITPSSTEFNQLHNASQGSGELEVQRVARCFYDVTVSGGGAGTSTLSCTLPANAVIVGGLLDFATGITGGSGATVAIQANTANDILSAHSINTNYFTGRMAIVPVYTAASAVKMTGASSLQVVIGSSTLTAGKFNLFIDYFLSQ